MNQINHQNHLLSTLIGLAALDADCDDLLASVSEEMLPELVRQAVRHGVAPWIHYRLVGGGGSNALVEPFVKMLRVPLISTFAANESNVRLLCEIEDLLAQHSVQVAALKGISLAMSLYPKPELRPIGDLDLYVSPGHVFEARDILIAHGAGNGVPPLSALHEKAHAHVRSISYKGRLVEFHQRLYDVGNRFNPDLDIDSRLSEFRFRNRTHRRLDDGLLAYHLATHLAYNIKVGGCRLGWFVDIALLFSNAGLMAHCIYENALQVNSKANSDIEMVVSMAASLMAAEARSSLANHCGIEQKPIPSVLLSEPGNISPGHKRLVVGHILHHPGVFNKMKLLFNEFFPSREYMAFFYPQYGGLKVVVAYFVRLFNIFR
jgi:hypothetical protein